MFVGAVSIMIMEAGEHIHCGRHRDENGDIELSTDMHVLIALSSYHGCHVTDSLDLLLPCFLIMMLTDLLLHSVNQSKPLLP